MYFLVSFQYNDDLVRKRFISSLTPVTSLCLVGTLCMKCVERHQISGSITLFHGDDKLSRHQNDKLSKHQNAKRACQFANESRPADFVCIVRKTCSLVTHDAVRFEQIGSLIHTRVMQEETRNNTLNGHLSRVDVEGFSACFSLVASGTPSELFTNRDTQKTYVKHEKLKFYLRAQHYS